MITIVPYVELEGIYTVPDETVKAVFFKMHLDGTWGTVFYDGLTNTPEDFIALLRSPMNYPVFVLVDGIVGGVAWLNELRNNHGTAHFVVFKEHWGKNSTAMGKEVLQYWFSFKHEDGKPVFDVILGVTPSEYKPAIRFVTSLGFRVVGEVPKVIYNAYTKTNSNAVLSYCERAA